MQAGVGAAALRLLCPLARHPEKEFAIFSIIRQVGRAHALSCVVFGHLPQLRTGRHLSLPVRRGMIHVEPFAVGIAVGNLLSVMSITTRHNGSRCRENILRPGKRTHSGPPRRTGFGRFDTHSALASGVAGGFRPITFTFRDKALWLRGKASGKSGAAAPPRLPFAAIRPRRKPPRRFDSEG